jgi:hypothetical protein
MLHLRSCLKEKFFISEKIFKFKVLILIQSFNFDNCGKRKEHHGIKFQKIVKSKFKNIFNFI